LDKQTDLRMTVRADARLLGCVRRLVRGYLESFETAPDRIDEVVLAVDEACANSIRHAYGGQSEECLSLEFRSHERGLEIELKDAGKTAPLERTGATLAARDAAGELRPGGLGIPLIRQVFDEVEFLAEVPHGNRVIMRLDRGKP